MVSVRFLPSYYIICSRIRSVARSDKLHEGCGGHSGRGEKGIEIKSQLKAALETDYFVILRKKSHCVCFFGASPSKRMAWPIFLSY